MPTIITECQVSDSLVRVLLALRWGIVPLVILSSLTFILNGSRPSRLKRVQESMRLRVGMPSFAGSKVLGLKRDSCTRHVRPTLGPTLQRFPSKIAAC